MLHKWHMFMWWWYKQLAQQSGEDEVSLCISGRAYTIDFHSMQQINDNTGTMRAVQRRMIPIANVSQSVSSIKVRVSSFFECFNILRICIFLSKNYVSEIFASVSNYLFKMLRKYTLNIFLCLDKSNKSFLMI